MRSKRTKSLDIPTRVKKTVWARDGECCVICGDHTAMPNAHYIPRSQGGLGIEENVVTLCAEHHHMYDQTTKRAEIKKILRRYLQSKYRGWTEEKLCYSKWKIPKDDERAL